MTAATATKTQSQTAMTTSSQSEWEARAISLAEQHHLVHRARYIGQGIVDEPLYQVPSRSQDGSCHVVRLYTATGRVACSCHASLWGKACGHCGSAILAERMRQEALRTPQDEPMRSFCNNVGNW
jgi:hypothetical protein